MYGSFFISRMVTSLPNKKTSWFGVIAYLTKLKKMKKYLLMIIGIKVDFNKYMINMKVCHSP